VQDLDGRPLWVAVVSLLNDGLNCVISMPPEEFLPVRDLGDAGALAIDTAVLLCRETPQPIYGIYAVYLSSPVTVDALRAFAIPHYGNITTHPAVVGLIVPSRPIGWDYIDAGGCGTPGCVAEA